MIAGEDLEGYDWPGKSDRWLGATRIARVRHHDGVSLENGWTEAASHRPSGADRRHALAARSERQRGRPGKHHRVWGAGAVVDRMARSAPCPRDTASEQRREGRAMKYVSKIALIAMVGMLAGNRIADRLYEARAKAGRVSRATLR